MKRLGFALLAAAVIGGTACSDDDGDAGVADELVYVSGDDQVGEINADLAAPLVVEVVTASGQPVEGVQIRWQALDGGAIDDANTNTGADGRTSVTFTLGAEPGAYNVRASVPGLDIGEVVFSAMANDVGGGGGGGL